MNTSQVTVDTHQLREMFADLKGRELKRAERTALRKSAAVLVREARKVLRRKVSKITTKHRGKNGKDYSLSRGIRYKVAKDAKSAKVNIMGDFRLKFFELGTEPRYAIRRNGRQMKKKALRGRIEPGRFSFFKEAQVNSRDKVFNEMGARVSEAIQKINAKKRR